MSFRHNVLALPIALLILGPAGFCEELSPAQKLTRAVQVQDLPKVQELLAQGIDPNTMEGERPLLGWAAQGGNVEIVRALLGAGAKVDTKDLGFGETPLLRAIENQHLEIVRELLKAKADPNAKDPQGESALARGVKSGIPEIVSALIDAGADAGYVSADGDSLALLAAQTGTSEGAQMITILAKAKADLNRSNLVYTPLYYAAELGSLELVKALLDGGADPNGKTDGGRTPLSAAIKHGEIVELLLAAKADPNLASAGSSPILIAAIENGTPEAVRALIKGGADPNVSDDRGNSALQVAQNYQRTDLAQLLKDHGATE